MTLPRGIARRMTPAERFAAYVEFDPNGGCHLWSSGMTQYGYGKFSVGKPDVHAHRFAVELTGQTIPPGMVIDHLCRVKACVNPAHLEVVNNRTNVLRGVGPSAQNASKTHCECGLALTPHHRKVERYCRPCRTAAERAYSRMKRSSAPTPDAGQAESMVPTPSTLPEGREG